MVREDEVLAAPMDVERVAEVLDRHGGAFDVPARTSGTPRTRPCWFTRLRGLPQRKVHRAVLPLIHFDTSAGLQLVELTLGKPPVGGKLLDLKVDITVDPVGDAFLKKDADEPDDLLHVIGGLGFHRCRADPEPPHIAVVGVDVQSRNGLPRETQFPGPIDDLVVHVREVLDERDVEASVFQVAADDVEDDGAAGVAEVRIIIDRHPAHVHADLAGHQRLERILPAGQGVEHLQHASALHAKAPMKGTKTQSPKSLMISCPRCFTPNCRRCTWRSPTGMTSRPPSRNCSTSNGGTLGDPAATRMASNGAASAHP